MGKIIHITDFSTYLFWDVDASLLSLEDNAAFIVKRVLELGQISDWENLKSYYGLDRIVQMAQSFRTLDPKVVSFLSVVSSIPKESFRCYSRKQSIRTL